jgi:hypothetical protein
MAEQIFNFNNRSNDILVKTMLGIKGERSEFILTLDCRVPTKILLPAGLYTTGQLPSGEDGDWGRAPKEYPKGRKKCPTKS